MEYVSIKNWHKYQHYSDRNPPWIKLYHSLLSDYEYKNLPDASKLLLISMFMLASKTNNKIPVDLEYIRQETKITGDIDFQPLIDTKFLLAYDASIRREEKRREEKIEDASKNFDEMFPKRDSTYKKRKTKFPNAEENIRPLLDCFLSLWLDDGCAYPSPQLRRAWIDGARKFYSAHGPDEELLEATVKNMRKKGLVIKSPNSCTTVAYTIKREKKSSPFYDDDGNFVEYE